MRAQQTTKIPRVGILSLGSGDSTDASRGMLDGFVAGLRDLRYTEGQNITFDRKFADGDVGKLGGLAQELVNQHVIFELQFAVARFFVPRCGCLHGGFSGDAFSDIHGAICSACA